MPDSEPQSIRIGEEELLRSIGLAQAKLDIRERIEALLNQRISALEAEIGRLHTQLAAQEDKAIAADVVAARPKKR